MPGTLFVVATPIGNLEDITARALRVLRDVSLIAAEDTRRTSHLLARYVIQTPTTSLHAYNEHKKTAQLIERLRQGENIALVSDAGTPTISDPGGPLIREAIESGIRIESIPGPSATLAALAVSGFAAQTFSFLGFPPIGLNDRNEWFDRLNNLDGTAIFFEAPHRVLGTLERMLIVLGDKPIMLARELTKINEELVRGPISLVLAAVKAPRGEYTGVIELGLKTKNVPAHLVTDKDLWTECRQLMEAGRITRRQAITRLARKYGRPAGDVYEAIKRGKNLVE